MNTKQTGDAGERFAEDLLKSKGYRMICRNFRCRAGEVDIICRKGGVLHFIEVKTRTGHVTADPAEAVDRRKQMRIRRAAEYYMMVNNVRDQDILFDVIAIEAEHIEECF